MKVIPADKIREVLETEWDIPPEKNPDWFLRLGNEKVQVYNRHLPVVEVDMVRRALDRMDALFPIYNTPWAHSLRILCLPYTLYVTHPNNLAIGQFVPPHYVLLSAHYCNEHSLYDLVAHEVAHALAHYLGDRAGDKRIFTRQVLDMCGVEAKGEGWETRSQELVAEFVSHVLWGAKVEKEMPQLTARQSARLTAYLMRMAVSGGGSGPAGVSEAPEIV